MSKKNLELEITDILNQLDMASPPDPIYKREKSKKGKDKKEKGKKTRGKRDRDESSEKKHEKKQRVLKKSKLDDIISDLLDEKEIQYLCKEILKEDNCINANKSKYNNPKGCIWKNNKCINNRTKTKRKEGIKREEEIIQKLERKKEREVRRKRKEERKRVREEKKREEKMREEESEESEEEIGSEYELCPYRDCGYTKHAFMIVYEFYINHEDYSHLNINSKKDLENYYDKYIEKPYMGHHTEEEKKNCLYWKNWHENYDPDSNTVSSDEDEY